MRAALQNYFDALHSSEAEAFGKMWHPRGELLQPLPEGKLAVLDADTFQGRVTKRAASMSEDYVKHDKVLTLTMLDERTAAARVQIVLPAAEPMHFVDFLVLLRDADGWRIISKAFIGKPLTQAQLAPRPPLPADFAAVAGAVWDGFVAANRAGDAEAMRRVFHKSARVTYATEDGLRVMDLEAFAAHVRDRWTLPDHLPFARLRGEARAAGADTLLGVEFAGPDLALATVRLGFPPRLYTEALTLARLEGGVWQVIAATTTAGAPFLEEERA